MFWVPAFFHLSPVKRSTQVDCAAGRMGRSGSGAALGTWALRVSCFIAQRGCSRAASLCLFLVFFIRSLLHPTLNPLALHLLPRLLLHCLSSSRTRVPGGHARDPQAADRRARAGLWGGSARKAENPESAGTLLRGRPAFWEAEATRLDGLGWRDHLAESLLRSACRDRVRVCTRCPGAQASLS